MVTDKLRSYGAAHRVAMLSVEHRSSKYLNNPRTPDTQQRDSAHRRAGHRPQLNIDATYRLLASTQNKVPALEKKANRAEDELKPIPAKPPQPTRRLPTRRTNTGPSVTCYNQAASPPTSPTPSPCASTDPPSPRSPEHSPCSPANSTPTHPASRRPPHHRLHHHRAMINIQQSPRPFRMSETPDAARCRTSHTATSLSS